LNCRPRAECRRGVTAMHPDESVVEISATLDAAPELVVAAFVDRRLISRWLAPSPDVRLEVLSLR
jgi:uncharacterized protein YndB with AHSA1/START domain